MEILIEVYARLVMARCALPHAAAVASEGNADAYICGAMELLRAKHPDIDTLATNLLVVEGVKC